MRIRPLLPLMIVLLLLTACGQPVTPMESDIAAATTTPTQAVEETDPPQAIILIGNEFGNTYFDMKTALEDQGFTVVTVGVGDKTLLSSCPNHENQPVTPDMNIKELDESNIGEYALIFIPAGKHHRTLPYISDVQRLLQLGKDEGLYLSAVCAGNIVLAEVDELIEGHTLAYSSLTEKKVKEAGGKVQYQSVVADGCFVTGAAGGGKSGNGHEGAPTQELAEVLWALVNEG